MKMFLVTRVFLTCYVLLYWSAHAVVGTSTESSCDIDIEDTLRALLADQDSPSIQVQALRRDLLRKIQEILERKALEDEESYYKRSLAALAASNNLPGKRNLEALARNGYIKTLPEEEDPNYKRSVANLAKNGQFPLRQEEPKRGIASLARNGDLRPPRKGIQDTLDDLYGKRNIASLTRNYELPNYQIQYKRNIASVARNGKFTGKRSVAPAVPQRLKREITDYQYENEEYPQLVHQNILDYEDMIQDLNAPIYDAADKRFLGSLRNIDVRHILYNMLPVHLLSVQNHHVIRVKVPGTCCKLQTGMSAAKVTEASANGETEIYANAKDPPLSVSGQRYFYSRPMTDDISLKQIFFHPGHIKLNKSA